jgi:outer membrane protein OmpA-like peptidoglycan-associated protein
MTRNLRDCAASDGRRQESKSIGAHIGTALAITWLICSFPYVAPSSAQPPDSEGDIAVSPQQPSVVLNFRFSDDLSDDAIKSLPDIEALARALASQDLKGSTFVIGCHVADSGAPAADQARSQRCADTVRRVLIEKSGMAAETLLSAGYGSSKPRNPVDQSSIENQRLEIVNMGPVSR